MNRITGDRLVAMSVMGVRVNSGTGDRLFGLSVRGVRVNIRLVCLIVIGEGERSYWGSFGWIECQGFEGYQRY